ncbi:MAG: hypothetical protein ACM31C_10570, partial [Acidobacteriota bacterium]
MKLSTGIGAVIVMTAGIATGGPPWGNRKDMAVCAKSLDRLSVEQACVDGPPKDASDECKAEIQKRMAVCKKLPADDQEAIDDCSRHL